MRVRHGFDQVGSEGSWHGLILGDKFGKEQLSKGVRGRRRGRGGARRRSLRWVVANPLLCVESRVWV
jgi:hypothetical protein